MRKRKGEIPPHNPTPCSTPEAHTVCPEDYLAWHAWAEKMGETHHQIRCRGCGLFRVWVPKERPRQEVTA